MAKSQKSREYNLLNCLKSFIKQCNKSLACEKMTTMTLTIIQDSIKRIKHKVRTYSNNKVTS